MTARHSHPRAAFPAALAAAAALALPAAAEGGASCAMVRLCLDRFECLGNAENIRLEADGGLDGGRGTGTLRLPEEEVPVIWQAEGDGIVSAAGPPAEGDALPQERYRLLIRRGGRSGVLVSDMAGGEGRILVVRHGNCWFDRDDGEGRKMNGRD